MPAGRAYVDTKPPKILMSRVRPSAPLVEEDIVVPHLTATSGAARLLKRVGRGWRVVWWPPNDRAGEAPVTLDNLPTFEDVVEQLKRLMWR